MDFVLKSREKAMGDNRIKWGWKTLLDLDYADDLGILDEPVCKINKLLEVSRVHGARIGLKINVKKTKSLRLGISEDKKMISGNEKIDQVRSFTNLDNIISKDGWSSEDVKSMIVRWVFSQLKKFGRIDRQVCKSRLDYWKVQRWQRSNMALKHGRSEKRMKIYSMSPWEIAYRLFWVPGWLTVFQAIGCKLHLLSDYFVSATRNPG